MALGKGAKARFIVLGTGPYKIEVAKGWQLNAPSGKVALHAMDTESLIGFYEAERSVQLQFELHVLEAPPGFNFMEATGLFQNFAIQMFLGALSLVTEGQFMNFDASGASDNPTMANVSFEGRWVPLT